VKYLKDQLNEVRKNLNYFRRMERNLIKDVQRICGHGNIKKYIQKERLQPMNYLHYNDVPATIVCQDCGKVLSKWKG